MAERDDELQVRVCRACNEKYDYPVKKSPATRFYCETCALLPEGVRTTVERLNKRVKELERKLSPKPVPAKPHG
jgi:hypothetical protein